MAVRVPVNQDRTISETFQRGFIRDVPPSVIPPGGVYDAVDFMFDQPGKVYKRGGFGTHSSAMGGNGRTIGIVDPPMRVVCLASDQRAYDVTSEAGPHAYDLGSMGINCSENPPFFNGLLIFTDDLAYGSGTGVSPKKAYFTSGPQAVIGTLGGSPPVAWRSTVHNGALLLARNFTNPNRIWISPATGVETTWDTTNSYFDTSWEITGLASIQGVLIVFSSHAVERILGDIPPAASVLDDNWQLQPVQSGIGCSDARSICHIDQGVVFANPAGVFVTDSVGVQPLIERADGSGISTYWRSLFSESVQRGISCGVMGRDYLFVTVFNKTTFAVIDTLLCYLPTLAWTRISNLDGVGYAAGNSENNTPIAQLFVAQGDRTTTVKARDMLFPTASNKADPSGTNITPSLRTRVFEGSPWLKAWGHAAVTLDMRDAASDNPTMAVTAYKGLDMATSKTIPESPIPETTQMTRKEMMINTDAHGVALNFAQSNPSASTEIRVLDIDVRDYNTGAQRL